MEEEFVKYLNSSKHFLLLNPNVCYLKYLRSESEESFLVSCEWEEFLRRPELKASFKNDLRLYAVNELLQYYKPVNLIRPKGYSETLILQQQKPLASKMLCRILSLPLGMACFKFSAGNAFLPEKFTIPPICLSIKLPPSFQTKIEPEIDHDESDIFSLCSFNNAVGHAIHFPASCSPIQPSWILYNKPAEYTPEFGGIIYGFCLGKNHSFLTLNFADELLLVGVPLLSIGVLLGVGLKFQGSCDLEAAEMISHYIPSFNGTGGQETEGSLTVQMAGIISAGLVYAGSCKKPIVAFLMEELRREGVAFINPKSTIYKSLFEKEIYSDAYRNCAAIAIGLICLSSAPNDQKITSVRNAGILKELEELSFNSLYCTSATLALTLIWLENLDLEMIKKSQTTFRQLVNSGVNPIHILYYGIFCRTIGNANHICPPIYPIDDLSAQDLLTSSGIGKLYDILSHCIATSLFHASTCKRETFEMISLNLQKLKQMKQEIELGTSNFSTKIASNAIQTCINSIYVCLGVLFAGSGDLEVFTLFRMEHEKFHEFSTHYSVHFALGLLFLGCGRFKLDVQKKHTILIAILPFFPNSPTDNSSYFEPLRFLWSCSTTNSTCASSLAPHHHQSPSQSMNFQLTNQLESHVSLKCHKAYEFIEKLFPSNSIAIQQNPMANFIKSELFSIFACGNLPEEQFLSSLNAFLGPSSNK